MTDTTKFDAAYSSGEKLAIRTIQNSLISTGVEPTAARTYAELLFQLWHDRVGHSIEKVIEIAESIGNN